MRGHVCTVKWILPFAILLLQRLLEQKYQSPSAYLLTRRIGFEITFVVWVPTLPTQFSQQHLGAGLSLLRKEETLIRSRFTGRKRNSHGHSIWQLGSQRNHHTPRPRAWQIESVVCNSIYVRRFHFRNIHMMEAWIEKNGVHDWSIFSF